MVFTINGHGGHLAFFSSPHPLEALYELWSHSAQWFQRRKRLKVWMDDGRTTESAYPISCPGTFGPGELKSLGLNFTPF